MINQIAIDKNNVVTTVSVGGEIENGIDVETIPEEVLLFPTKWLYKDGEFVENPSFGNIILEETKSSKITESKAQLAQWLKANPMLYTDGRFYSVTEEKQSLLNSNLASYERAKSAGIEYPLKWNSTGDECVAWTYAELVALSLSIAAYVAPKVTKQQEIELAIKACETAEELEGIVVSYD